MPAGARAGSSSSSQLPLDTTHSRHEEGPQTKNLRALHFHQLAKMLKTFSYSNVDS